MGDLMSVNSKVDTTKGLLEVPGLDVASQFAWKIRLLRINDKSLALAALSDWERNANDEYRKISKVMRIVGTSNLPPRRPHVGKSDKYDVYEMIGDNARLLFFYDKTARVVVCTNSYEKNSSTDPGTAFGLCERLRQEYVKWPPQQRIP